MDVSVSQPNDNYNYLSNYLGSGSGSGSIEINPSAIIISVGVVALFVIFFSFLGSSGNSEDPMFQQTGQTDKYKSNINILGGIMIAVFIVLVIINAVSYIFGFNIVASLKNIFTGEPTIGLKVSQDGLHKPSPEQPPVVPEIRNIQQVFNIPGNYFNYDEASTLCSAYGARLASYNEIENAYKDGAEWCNYGWSADQMALFPTQTSTYEGLQKIKGHEHDCGRPGVNGGYMANPKMQFGVNCYGYKPKITKEEEELMSVSTPYPKTEKDIMMEHQVEYWKTKLDDILVSPFNYDSWSKY
jgi:hypothetical protein